MLNYVIGLCNAKSCRNNIMLRVKQFSHRRLRKTTVLFIINKYIIDHRIKSLNNLQPAAE